MQGMRFTVNIHLPGTLAADQSGALALPCAATLEQVAACGSNANDATLAIGTSADPDGLLTAAAIGDSSTPEVWANPDWDGALAPGDGVSPPHLDNATVIVWSLDFDGAAGTAAADVDILFTFIEG